MASTAKFSYQRLRHEGWFEDEDDEERQRRVIMRGRSSWTRLKKVHIRKRFKVRIPSLKRFLRRKARLYMVSLAKVLRRLKDSQSHFGDLFAGNYLFLQVTPTPLKCVVDRSRDLHALSSSGFSLPTASYK